MSNRYEALSYFESNKDFFENTVEANIEKYRKGDMTVGENVYYGGLIRFNMTPKPAYRVLCDLIHKKWHTELDLDTNTQGRVDFRGFYGDYEIEIIKDGKAINKQFTLSSKGEGNLTITI